MVLRDLREELARHDRGVPLTYAEEWRVLLVGLEARP